MPSPELPWEPPLAGSEPEHLLGALDRLRTTFRWKADGLSEAELRAALPSSTLTIGGLLKHLALVESFYSRFKFAGESPGRPWDAVDWDAEPGWDFSSATDDPAEALYCLYDDAVAQARATYSRAIAEDGLDQPVHAADDDGRHASLRRMLFDLVEEYGRHTGHADLLREAIDGRVGEDPPPDWRAICGTYDLPAGAPPR